MLKIMQWKNKFRIVFLGIEFACLFLYQILRIKYKFFRKLHIILIRKFSKHLRTLAIVPYEKQQDMEGIYVCTIDRNFYIPSRKPSLSICKIFKLSNTYVGQYGLIFTDTHIFVCPGMRYMLASSRGVDRFQHFAWTDTHFLLSGTPLEAFTRNTKFDPVRLHFSNRDFLNKIAVGACIPENWVPYISPNPGIICHIKKLLVFHTNNWHGYYHWMCEIVPRLAIVKAFLTQHPDMKILLDIDYDGLLPNTYAQESLHLLDLSENQIVKQGGCLYLVEDMYFLQAFEVYYTPPELICEGRKQLLTHATSVQRDPITIVIIKRKGIRTSSNHQELFSAVKSMESINKSIHVVEFDGEGSLLHQINVFAGAMVVIGVHGGALSNIMFCKDHSHVIEIMPKSGCPKEVFANLALACNLRYHCVQSMTGSWKGSQLEVPVKEVVRVVEKCLKEISL